MNSSVRRKALLIGFIHFLLSLVTGVVAALYDIGQDISATTGSGREASAIGTIAKVSFKILQPAFKPVFYPLSKALHEQTSHQGSAAGIAMEYWYGAILVFLLCWSLALWWALTWLFQRLNNYQLE